MEKETKSKHYRIKMLPSLVVAATLISTVTVSQAAKSNKILLDNLNVITLRHGAMTSARRSQPVPQLKCTGGSAGCSSFIPQVVQCYNRGSDGYDVQWECKTDMDNAYRFGRIEVSCEGFDYPDDPYVLTGSCGLEYTIDLTKEGYHQQNQGHNYYGSQNSKENHYHSEGRHNTNYQQKWKGGSGLVGNIIMYVIIGLIIYGLYKTCWVSSPQPGADGHYRQPGDDPYRARPSAPPPPGFRQDYMPNQGGCSSTYDSTYTNTHTGAGTGNSGFGGFWSGAATGGILGYLLGNNGNSRTYTHHRPYGSSGWGSSGLGSGWGSSWTSGSSGFGGSSGGSSWGSSGSTGTRTASGFGGTRRR